MEEGPGAIISEFDERGGGRSVSTSPNGESGEIKENYRGPEGMKVATQLSRKR